MFIHPQAREKARALAGAAGLGALVGLAIGGAYLAGGLARVTVAHQEIQRLAGAASDGFSESALKSTAGDSDAAVLAIAAQHDPIAVDVDDAHDRQVAALVERLEARRAARGGRSQILLAAERPIAAPKALIRAATRPFHLRGALDQSRDLECLTQAVYYEARGEPVSGQKAVAQVILNRVRAPSFPKSVCGVVFQGLGSGRCQFSFACGGQVHHPLESAAWRRSEKVAADALGGQVMAEVGDATHFHGAGGSSWGSSLMKVAQIGAHVFYRFTRHGEDHVEEPQGGQRPLFASLALAPTGGKSEPPSKLLASASQAVEKAASHAATAVETAAKQVAGEGRPTATEPVRAAPTDETRPPAPTTP